MFVIRSKCGERGRLSRRNAGPLPITSLAYGPPSGVTLIQNALNIIRD